MSIISPDRPVHVRLSHDRGEFPQCMDGARIDGLHRDYALVTSDGIEIYDGGNNCGNDAVAVWSGTWVDLQAKAGKEPLIYASDLTDILGDANAKRALGL